MAEIMWPGATPPHSLTPFTDLKGEKKASKMFFSVKVQNTVQFFEESRPEPAAVSEAEV